MLRTLTATLSLVFSSLAYSQATTDSLFHPPQRLAAAGQAIQLDSPGYAAPTIADIDNDGLADLIVGQFRKGQLNFYKNVGTTQAPRYAKGVKLTSGSQPASVPGVW